MSAPEAHLLDSTAPVLRFVALGGVWLDEIRTENQDSLYKDVLGGSVTFATLGARLFESIDSSSIKLAFIAGHDFPQTAIKVLQSWNVDLTILWRDDQPSARGIVRYARTQENRKSYDRLTSPLLTTPPHLPFRDMLRAQTFHFFDTPSALEPQITHLLEIRDACAIPNRPLLVWEPQAKTCDPSTLQQHLNSAALVDVFSPNHAELASFFPPSPPAAFSPALVEQQALAFVQAGIGRGSNGCIVVRAAEHGCLVMSRSIAATWLPSFYGPGAGEVVDPTGAGNAFLGGLAIGYIETQDYVAATVYGTVAASFALEQIGLPSVSGAGETELWNGVNVRRRLEAYRSRLRTEAE